MVPVNIWCVGQAIIGSCEMRDFYGVNVGVAVSEALKLPMWCQVEWLVVQVIVASNGVFSPEGHHAD